MRHHFFCTMDGFSRILEKKLSELLCMCAHDCNCVCPKKSSPFYGLGIVLFQGSWAYLGPCGMIAGLQFSFQGHGRPGEIEFFFLNILSCMHYYIENFPKLNLAKVLFLLQPLYTVLVWQIVINFPKDDLSLLYF